MGFDSKRFLATQFIPREEDVPVKDLKDFFGEGDKPVWRVRGLTGYELGKVEEIKRRNRKIENIIEGIVSDGSRKQVQAIRQLIGNTKEATDDIAKRLEMLVIGSVDPECDLDLAIKLLTAFPIEFFDLTNRVNLLTGKGHIPGKAKPSGKTPKSEQA